MDRLDELDRARKVCVLELHDATTERNRVFERVIEPLNDTIRQYSARITAIDLQIAQAKKGEAA